MRQLILDLLPDSPPTLDNFVPGGNEETLAALTGWLAGQCPETAFCLHGESLVIAQCQLKIYLYI